MSPERCPPPCAHGLPSASGAAWLFLGSQALGALAVAVQLVLSEQLRLLFSRVHFCPTRTYFECRREVKLPAQGPRVASWHPLRLLPRARSTVGGSFLTLLWRTACCVGFIRR